ncbi:unnamed protein product [Angiostrongylus costaricensis]|uniref:Cytochrome P450 n=1 Tax=Angiostrongylus costaricensis TaxID=334426 RepID=A0A0R3PQX1_ANGCS|nr:unnamed protein product [Angiostrongylus costaricensis]
MFNYPRLKCADTYKKSRATYTKRATNSGQIVLTTWYSYNNEPSQQNLVHWPLERSGQVKEFTTKYFNSTIMSNLTLESHKRIRTRYTNQLQKVLTRFKDTQLEEISIQNLQDEITPTVIHVSLQQLEGGVAALKDMTLKIQHALDELAIIFEKAYPTPRNIEDEFAQYSSTAEEAIGNTFEYLVLLHARIHGFKAHAKLFDTSKNPPLRTVTIRNPRSLQSRKIWSYPQYQS